MLLLPETIFEGKRRRGNGEKLSALCIISSALFHVHGNSFRDQVTGEAPQGSCFGLQGVVSELCLDAFNMALITGVKKHCAFHT